VPVLQCSQAFSRIGILHYEFKASNPSIPIVKQTKNFKSSFILRSHDKEKNKALPYGAKDQITF
jgi:hypothetical protein